MLQIQNVLFARDFSDSSERALPYALAIARRLHAALHVAFVEVPHGRLPTDEPADLGTLRERLVHVGDLVEGGDVDSGGLRIVSAILRSAEPASALLDYAAEHDVDLIVMGTHGRRGVGRLVLGSVAEEVVRLAPCPVLTVRQREAHDAAPARFGTILVPVDFSEHAREALRHARALAELLGASLELLHVVETYQHQVVHGPAAWPAYGVDASFSPEPLREKLEAFFRETIGPADPAEPVHPAVTFTVRVGHTAQEILDHAAEAQADLVVMATHGRTGLRHVLVGSVAERVVRGAPCPVFTLKSFGRSLLPAPAAAAAP